MTSKAEIWKNAQEVVQAYTPFYQQEAVQEIRDANAINYWFPLLLAHGAEPEPFSKNYFRVVNPFISDQLIGEKIQLAIEDGCLKENPTGEFRLTEQGYHVINAFFQTAYKGLAQAPTLSQAEMNRLSQLLGKLVAAAEAAPEPEHKYALASSRWTEPENDASSTLMVDQFTTDLGRFRDDAHIEAWQQIELLGQEKEVLTYVWKGDAHTAAELAEKLENRGYSEAEYAEALHVLQAKGYLESKEEYFQITPAGKSLRDSIEEETDRLFFSPWSALSEKELQTMNTLLVDLTHVLQKSVEAEAVPA